jgi:hypothetical protein
LLRPHFRRFLAERGVITMKENRPIGSVTAIYGPALEISSQVLAIVRGSARDVSVGVKFEQPETQTALGATAFIDADEVAEFMEALSFIITSAMRMAASRRDYTEVAYATRDHLSVGFYQDGLKQQAFAKLGATARYIFFGMLALGEIQTAVREATAYVNSRRVAWEAQQ